MSDWFKSYLCNRQQYTVINNVSSFYSCGVPHGSTSGPLLFLLYVNDISRVLPGEKIKLFDDDTNLFISGLDVNTLNQKSNYCIKPRWHVNVKTNIMLFSKNKANDISVELQR